MRHRGVWRGRERNVTLVAGQRQIPPRTVSQILSQIGINTADFARLMNGEDIS